MPSIHDRGASSDNLAATTKWSRKRRYTIAACLASIVIGIAAYSAAQSDLYKGSKTWNFDSPSDVTTLQQALPNPTDSHDTGSWKIIADGSAPSTPNVLVRSPGNGTDLGYHLLALPDGPIESNYKASLKFKLTEGAKDQGTVGLLVRIQDQSHYFILMVDSSAQRFSLCRFEPGTLLCTQDKDISITTGGWHTITAQVSSQGIAGYLDDKLLLQRYDQHYMSGTIGLMTKGNTAASFDDLSMNY